MDSYAALRQELFLTEDVVNSAPDNRDRAYGFAESPPEGTDALSRYSRMEFGWMRAFRNGQSFPSEIFDQLGLNGRTAILRGLNRSQAPVDPTALLARIGLSGETDSLVRDALAYLLAKGVGPDFMTAMHRRVLAHDVQPQALVVILDIAAEHRAPILSTAEVYRLLKAWDGYDTVSVALLRYVSALRLAGTPELLQRLLDEVPEAWPALSFSMVDALAQLKDPVREASLARLATQFSAEGDPRVKVLRQHIDTTVDAIRASGTAQPPPDGLVMAQSIFTGQIGQSGKGDSGGLGIFLTALGDALAEMPGISRVYTLTLINVAQLERAPSLVEQHAPNHTILRIPIYSDRELDQYQMMVQEYSLRTAIERALNIHRIEPDIFHIRYSDHGSRAVVQVAKRMGKKVVFTLTPDPHRKLTSAFAKPVLTDNQAKALVFELHKVYVADQLLKSADGLVAILHSDGIAPLKAYFPQFSLQRDIQAKPLRLIAEGVPMLQDALEHRLVQEVLVQGLSRYETSRHGHQLDMEFCNRPIILSVGRLHPMKQQDLLVEAWAGSSLWREYNLVLIGGNLENPNPNERAILEAIEATLACYPQVRGRFSLLPAMPNEDVRILERGIIRNLPTGRPHVYACSSFKEEFGIAVLEAMEAGFLIFGPKQGGLSSYIVLGENGFLIDTKTAAGIGQMMERVLLSGQYTANELRSIAQAGTRTVRERFDIRAVAEQFARFYHELSQTSES